MPRELEVQCAGCFTWYNPATEEGCWKCGNENIGDTRGAPPPKPKKVNKYEHVRRAKQTRRHGCHWPGCTRQVRPAMWGCKEHWFRLPQRLRSAIWRAYDAGQEKTLTPSPAYVEVAREVQDWIRDERVKQRMDEEGVTEQDIHDAMPERGGL